MRSCTARLSLTSVLRAVGGAVLVASCGDSRAPVDRTTVLQPLAWIVSDTIITVRFDRHGDSDVVQPACDSSGLWSLPVDGGNGVLQTSKVSCAELFSAAAIEFERETASLVFADARRDGRIVRQPVAAPHAETVLEDSCLTDPASFAINSSHSEVALLRGCGAGDTGAVWLVRLSDGARQALSDSSLYGRVRGMSWDARDSLLAFDFSSSEVGASRIYVVDRTGHSIAVIETGTYPAWSPQGDEIAVVVQRDNGLYQEMHVVTLGTMARRVVVTSDSARRGAANWVPSIFGPLVWSPNGDRIAFSGDCGVAVVDVAGAQVTWLAGRSGLGSRKCQ